MSSENDLVKRFGDLIKQSTPSIVRSQTGLSITQNGQTFQIPFAIDDQVISSKTLTKK